MEMTNKTRRLWQVLYLAPFIALLPATSVLADELNRPANFDHPERKRQLDALIEYPKEVSGKVALVLSCLSRIKDNGKMDQTGCYQKDQYEASFTATVIKAAKKARLTPAIVNGKAEEIYLQFRVEFAREGEDSAVRLYLNPGYEENVLAYGFDHVAGQRVISKKEPWLDACPSHARYSVWVRAYLSEEGRAENPTVEFGNGIRPVSQCIDAIKQTIIASRYTPAYAEGVAVPSTYIEIFSN